ncbi:hypothetical protein PVAP13_1NG553900 [Panicum virgatum]|uniref:C2H2-type domain-containing protein n=1 Tax=Panicum virgatum TaxID=38727 RepID=A0A8T0WZW8_PANVG|nr:hypothetical protein PVAP13_1NG553900 [Panicum virgatum]
MDLSQETKDNKASPSGEAPDDDKELQKQRAGSSGGGDDNDDDEGTRQPYKCTFCRRGFPTAQALGGHMNVHRRHRGRPTTGAAAVQGITSSSRSGCYEQQQQPYHSTTAATTVVAFGGQTHPASVVASSMAAGGAALLHAERHQQQPHELRLFGRDCAAGGRAKEGGAAGDARRDRCYAKDGDGGGDHGGAEELDLELRLGGAGS